MSAIGLLGVNRDQTVTHPRDEEELVEAARHDREAFGVLYDRYFDDIYNYVAKRVGDAQVAEDLTGAVWERALVAIERYEVRGVPFSAWLFRIAGNLIANHHRKQGLRHLVPLTGRFRSRSSEGHLGEAADERAMVREAMSRLSESDQEILGLCYYAGLRPQEIADVLACSPSAVHKRLHRARTRLKQQLEGDIRVATRG